MIRFAKDGWMNTLWEWMNRMKTLRFQDEWDEFLRNWMRNNKMAFTLKIYIKILHSLLANDYSFQTFHDFIQQPNNKKIVILRHDNESLKGFG